MALSDLTPDAVRSAVEEYQTLGRAKFLKKYGFRQARSYFLVIDEERYDSKAIAGAAHGYLMGREPLESSAFSGGEATVVKTLQELGFVVELGIQQPRNTPWVRDELILALELYLTNSGSPPGKSSIEVARLSLLLKQLGAVLGFPMGEDHRNPNGVYMKVMNFRRFDPSFQSEGKVGLSHGAAGDEHVWKEFSDRKDDLSRAAAEIRRLVLQPELQRFLPDEGQQEAEEGRLISAQHFRRERDPKIAAAKRRQVLAEGKPLMCECCGLVFHDRYGEHGRDFIEVHHTVPLHTYDKGGGTTRLKDLALVCANCHRMIHRKSSWLSVDQLRELIARQHDLPPN